MRVLINTPPPSDPGGVANHYKGLREYWSEDVIYNYIGGRNSIPGPLILIYDLIIFISKIIYKSPDLVVLNPSLGKTAIQRDALYLKISKLFNIPTIIFFHGWDKKQEKKINKNPKLFFRKYQNTDTFLVLASNFKKTLKDWGIEKPIYLTTTKVDDSLIHDFNIDNKDYDKTLLFLARIVKEKGIFTTLKAFKKIKEKYPRVELTVAGSGDALDDAKSFVADNSILDVNFTGYISGKKLKSIFRNSDLYLFPTTHGEGMPTSVLEAMAFGLPIISRPVGGMIDFFENAQMGYLLESTDPDDYAEKVIELFENKETFEIIGRYNHNYASQNFLASKVAGNLEKIFRKVLD